MTGQDQGKTAVALQYDGEGAPRVTAKGEGSLAEKIVETAKLHGVAIEEVPGLAEALSTVELDAEIPVELYQAVAEVISYVMRMAQEAR